MKTLKQYFQEAMAGKWAVGHFNFSTADQLRAIIEAAAELKSPVMVGTSEGEAKFVGRDQAVALVRSYQQDGHVVYLNADHHKSWDSVKEAVDAGYDSALIDASKMSYEENVALTKQVVDYARSKNTDIMVEGELGYLKGSSEVQAKIEISPEDYTKPEQAQDFIAKTGVDRLAVVFGNIHGIVTEQEEHLNIDTLKAIVAALPNMSLVLHGASGLPTGEVQEAIRNGITNVHINTDIRLAYHDKLHQELEAKPKETTTYKYLGSAFEEVKKIVKEKLELFGSVGKI